MPAFVLTIRFGTYSYPALRIPRHVLRMAYFWKNSEKEGGKKRNVIIRDGLSRRLRRIYAPWLCFEDMVGAICFVLD